MILMAGVGLQQVHAQNGGTALGLRLTPDGGGFTGKFYANRNVAIEVQLNAGGVMGGNGESFTAVALAEYHIYMPDPSWQIFLGGGLHAGVWDHDGRNYRRGEYFYGDDDNEGIFGIDGIMGVQYKFRKIPLSLSADLKPAINFLSEPAFFPHNIFGVAARFHL